MKTNTIYVLLLFIGMSSIFGQNPDSGLVAKYYFNGNANDESGSGFDGIIYGATLTTDRFGNANKAYLFDGTSSYIKATAHVIPASGNFSIAVWEKLVNTNKLDLEILSQTSQTMGTDYSYIGKDWQTDTIRIGDQWQNAHKIFPKDTNWHSFVVTKTNFDIFLYLDNQLISHKGDSIQNPLGTTFYIGRQYPPNTEYFPGKIDDIRIYNCALNSNQIDYLFHETSTSINNYENSNNFSIYPNPANDKIKLELNVLKNSIVSIYNIQGQLLLQQAIKHYQTEIDISSFARGMYFVKVETDKGIVSKKFIKE